MVQLIQVYPGKRNVQSLVEQFHLVNPSSAAAGGGGGGVVVVVVVFAAVDTEGGWLGRCVGVCVCVCVCVGQKMSSE